jgi:hypothetical protein
MRSFCFFSNGVWVCSFCLLACCSDYVHPLRMPTYHTRPIRFSQNTLRGRSIMPLPTSSTEQLHTSVPGAHAVSHLLEPLPLCSFSATLPTGSLYVPSPPSHPHGTAQVPPSKQQCLASTHTAHRIHPSIRFKRKSPPTAARPFSAPRRVLRLTPTAHPHFLFRSHRLGRPSSSHQPHRSRSRLITRRPAQPFRPDYPGD